MTLPSCLSLSVSLGLCWCWLLVASGLLPARALDLYVSNAHGSDLNSGLTLNEALKTLQSAQLRVRKRLLKSKKREGEGQGQGQQELESITVNILPGLYFEELHFTTADSGTVHTPIHWRAVHGHHHKHDNDKNGNADEGPEPEPAPEQVIISGGRIIAPSSFYPCQSPLAKDNSHLPLMCVDLKAANITNIGGMLPSAGLKQCSHNKSSLYYDTNLQILSRYPNINRKTNMFVFTNILAVTDISTFTWNGDCGSAGDCNVQNWNKESDAWMHGYWQYDWADMYVPMTKIAAQSNQIYALTSDQFENDNFLTPAKGHRFYVTNFLSELDAVNEYYIDRSTMILYWYPPTTSLQNSIFLSVNEYGIRLDDNVENMHFEDLSILYTKNTGFLAHNVMNVSITNCEISNHGNTGIDVSGYNLRVTNNHVKNTGCIGVSCVGGDYYALKPGNNVFDYNYIYNFATYKRTYTPGLFFGGVGNDYSHNNITFGPHNAIDGGGNEAQGCDNNFTYNLLQNTTFETSDSGSFYTCGQSKQGWINRGNVFAHNTVKNIRNLVPLAGDQDAVLNGIYLDDQMSGWRINFNTFINIDRGVFIGGGRSNQVYNNYCLDCDDCLHLDNRGMGWQASACAYPNGLLWEGMYAVNYTYPPWSTAYPQMAKITKDNTCIPVFNDFQNNEYCHGKLADFTEANAQAWQDTMINNTNNCR